MCVSNLPHKAVQVVRQITKEVYAKPQMVQRCKNLAPFGAEM